MTIPGNDSNFWPCLLIVVLCVGYILNASLATRNGFDPRSDGQTLLTMIGTVILYVTTKRSAVGPQQPKE